MRTMADLYAMAEFVRTVAGDYEAAHGAEDRLHIACLEAIEAGDVEPREAAMIGLSTRDLGFPRYTS